MPTSGPHQPVPDRCSTLTDISRPHADTAERLTVRRSRDHEGIPASARWSFPLTLDEPLRRFLGVPRRHSGDQRNHVVVRRFPHQVEIRRRHRPRPKNQFACRCGQFRYCIRPGRIRVLAHQTMITVRDRDRQAVLVRRIHADTARRESGAPVASGHEHRSRGTLAICSQAERSDATWTRTEFGGTAIADSQDRTGRTRRHAHTDASTAGCGDALPALGSSRSSSSPPAEPRPKAGNSGFLPVGLSRRPRTGIRPKRLPSGAWTSHLSQR